MLCSLPVVTVEKCRTRWARTQHRTGEAGFVDHGQVGEAKLSKDKAGSLDFLVYKVIWILSHKGAIKNLKREYHDGSIHKIFAVILIQQNASVITRMQMEGGRWLADILPSGLTWVHLLSLPPACSAPRHLTWLSLWSVYSIMGSFYFTIENYLLIVYTLFHALPSFHPFNSMKWRILTLS